MRRVAEGTKAAWGAITGRGANKAEVVVEEMEGEDEGMDEEEEMDLVEAAGLEAKVLVEAGAFLGRAAYSVPRTDRASCLAFRCDGTASPLKGVNSSLSCRVHSSFSSTAASSQGLLSFVFLGAFVPREGVYLYPGWRAICACFTSSALRLHTVFSSADSMFQHSPATEERVCWRHSSSGGIWLVLRKSLRKSRNAFGGRGILAVWLELELEAGKGALGETRGEGGAWVYVKRGE